MNRRGFIAKALAGVAAIPLLGKMVQAKPAPEYAIGGPVDRAWVEREGHECFYPFRDPPALLPVHRSVKLTISRETFWKHFGGFDWDTIREKDRVSINGVEYRLVSCSIYHDWAEIELWPIIQDGPYRARITPLSSVPSSDDAI